MVLTLLIILIGVKFLIALSPALEKTAFRVTFVTSLLILVSGFILIKQKISFVSLILDISGGILLIAAFSFIIWNLPRIFYNMNALTFRKQFFIHKFLSVISGPIYFALVFFIVYVKPDKEIKLSEGLMYKERKFRKPIFFPDLTIEITEIDASGLLERHFLRKDYHTRSVGYTDINATLKKGTLYLENFPTKKSQSFKKFKDSININGHNW